MEIRYVIHRHAFVRFSQRVATGTTKEQRVVELQERMCLCFDVTDHPAFKAKAKLHGPDGDPVRLLLNHDVLFVLAARTAGSLDVVTCLRSPSYERIVQSMPEDCPVVCTTHANPSARRRARKRWRKASKRLRIWRKQQVLATV